MHYLYLVNINTGHGKNLTWFFIFWGNSNLNISLSGISEARLVTGSKLHLGTWERPFEQSAGEPGPSRQSFTLFPPNPTKVPGDQVRPMCKSDRDQPTQSAAIWKFSADSVVGSHLHIFIPAPHNHRLRARARMRVGFARSVAHSLLLLLLFVFFRVEPRDLASISDSNPRITY